MMFFLAISEDYSVGYFVPVLTMSFNDQKNVDNEQTKRARLDRAAMRTRYADTRPFFWLRSVAL